MSRQQPIANVAATFPARVIRAVGNGVYVVRERRRGATHLPAINLAELGSPTRPAVTAGTVVQVVAVPDGLTPPTLRYVFNHPTGEQT